MSLDVSLYAVESCPNCGHHIGTRHCVYDANITHNLGAMADAAGIYLACWRPDELVNPAEAEVVRALERDGQWNNAYAMRAKFPCKPRAFDLIPVLREGLAKMKANRAYYEQFNAPNGWGLYEHFVPWVERYLAACEEHPSALVEVSR